MAILRRFTNLVVRICTWFMEKIIAIRVAFKSKHINTAQQDTLSTNKHKNLDKMNSNEDLSLDQYLETAQGQLELSQAKMKFGETLLQQLTMKYYSQENPPSMPQKMLLSLAIQQTVRELQKEEEKVIPN